MSDLLPLFQQPISWQTWKAVKKSLAKTSLLGFRPKWFRNWEKSLNADIKLLAILSARSNSFANDDFDGALDSIIQRVENLQRLIAHRRPKDPSIDLLKTDIETLKKARVQ